MAREHDRNSWPELPLGPWAGTRDALHMWTQIVGKTLLARSYPANHWWHCALRVGARGLATASPVYDGHRAFDIELDLVDHVLSVRSDGRTMATPLVPRSVHAFHDEYLALLRAFGVDLRIWTMPVEVPNAVPFDRDDAPREYDADAAHRFWEVLRRCDAALKSLSNSFAGKQSPVMREVYSHEVVSFGFWPGGHTQTGVFVDEPILYAYAAPEPRGFRDATVRPAAARYDERLGEFVLPYEAVRTATDPAAVVRAFCEDAYEAAATLGKWDRAALERRPEASPSQPAL